MVILDLSIVNVALPSIQTALDFSTTQLQWVIDAYAIVFAGFLMLGGRAADHFGQRRTFVVSLALFAATSLIGGMSVSSQMLIAARAFQGLSGALMAATSLAIITASFPTGPARHRAIGLWSAMNGAGGAAGTLLGGVLTQELSWRWILLINPPIGLVAAFIAYRVVTERKRGEDAPRFDIAGALTMTLGTLVLVYGIVDTGVDGWSSPKALVPMGLGLFLLALFAVVETRLAAAPLVPFRELTGPMKLANAIVLLFSASLFPMWYVSSLYLQQVLGLSPLSTGLAFLPMTLVIMLVASRAGKLVGRFGVRTVMGSGLVLMSAGMLLFARIGPSGSAWGYIVLPGVLTTAGIALSIVPSTIFATQGAGPAQAGLASGLVNTSRQAGGGLGLAVLITLATGYTRGAVGKGTAVTVALTEGFRLAFLVGAGLVIAAAIVTFAFVHPATARSGAPAGAGPDGPAGGVPGLRPQWRFGMVIVAVLALFGALDFGVAGSKGPALGAYTTKGAYDFVSAPGLHPPKIAADAPTKTSQLAPGYIMVANFYDLTTRPMIGQSGPLILNNDLQPVWFRPVPQNVVASDLATQTYHKKPVLTWWQGTITDTGQTQSGEDVIVNQHYQTVATLHGKDGWVPTMHEFLIRGNDAWVTADKNIPMNLAKYGGTSEGVLDDSAIQEYDIKTGQLLYTWNALHHLPLTDSHAQPPANGFPWDAYHVNSLQLVGQGKFLVSMRNTWAAYLAGLSQRVVLPGISRARSERKVAAFAPHPPDYLAGGAAHLVDGPRVTRRDEEVAGAVQRNTVDVEVIPGLFTVLRRRRIRLGQAHVLVAAPLEQHLARRDVEFLGHSVVVGAVGAAAVGPQVPVAEPEGCEVRGPLGREEKLVEVADVPVARLDCHHGRVRGVGYHVMALAVLVDNRPLEPGEHRLAPVLAGLKVHRPLGRVGVG